MLNLKNTLDGYLKNVEVIGNTVQDENNLAGIRSVGDKVEGQELYKIPVVSCGKNLFDGVYKDNSFLQVTGGGIGDLGGASGHKATPNYVKLKPNSTYRFSTSNSQGVGIILFFYDKNKKYIRHADTHIMPYTTLTTNENEYYIRWYGTDAKISSFTDVQIEDNTVATSYEPYQEQKLEILSPVQLEKVGDVADRIVCKDGVWGIEKHIGHYTFVGNEITMSQGSIGSTNRLYWAQCNTVLKNKPSTRVLICNVQKYGICGTPNKEGLHYICFNGSSDNMLFDTDKDIPGANNYLKGNYIKYILAEPQFIPLPQDQQVKLRTFAGQTNIAFLTEIPGQIKAQVPKSLGATVNTHTEQIADLHNSLERVRKLEETTVSTIETESNFTTVDATSNGYFEDVKLEGKTLVNHLCNSENTVSSTNATSKSYVGLQVGKTYTAVVNVIENNNNKTFYPFRITYSDNSQINIPSSAYPKGSVITYKFELADKGINFLWVNWCASYVEGDIITTKTLLLEGDHTNNPPEFFEGLMSVGQDVDEVSVASVSDNILDIRNTEMKLISSSENVPTNARILTDTEIYYKGKYGVFFNVYLPKGTFNIGFSKEVISGDNNSTTIRVYREGDLSKVLASGVNTTQLTSEGAKYSVCFYGSMGIEVECKLYNLYINACNVHHIEHQSNKKPLLYYNPTTETWEKPILREFDTIEKHSDGKYYYHKRSGEVALNGSESWNVGAEQATTIRCQLSLNTIKPQSNLICDKFAQILGGTDSEGISNHFSSNMLQLTLNKDKGSVKQWLQANPTTVVYQLAQEEVYECTNIDLMTYSGETNYIINSGTISPKSLLKVHNNISNVVKILQEKVSLLENTFIAGLKSVLSGDMYSLATILYPEDFEQNDNIEQDIMVIPE